MRMRPAVKQLLEKKIGKAQIFIFGTSFYLEVFAAACIIFGILITFSGVPLHLSKLLDREPFLEFLQYMFNIVIGIELLKMFCRHDLDSVVEVLLFAVARQVIIEHTSMVDNLLGVLAIAILFSIRKFLFVSALDKKSAAFTLGNFNREEPPTPKEPTTLKESTTPKKASGAKEAAASKERG